MNTLPPSLSIYYEARLVGTLRAAGGVYSLKYAPDWREDGVALSVKLPLTQAEYEGDVVRYFFDNLLPEERVRRKVAQRYQVSESNIYGMLCHLGRECAGAFSLVPEGEEPSLAHADDYRLLSDAELETMVGQLRTVPFLAEDRKVSMSLAGAQEKLPLLRRGRYFYLPQNGAPSNRILKPDIDGLESSAVNEHYCLMLAQKARINTVKSRVLTMKGKCVLCVERYDREQRSKAVRRLHQEDFCQVTGLPHDCKYEQDGGPGFKDCAKIIRRYSDVPMFDLIQLCDWGIFNACVGNADAHAKNLSLLHTEKGIRLAPFYDIVSTAFYGERFAPEMAMSIGGKRLPKDLTLETWCAYAHDLGLPEPWLLDRVDGLCRQILKEMTPLADRLIANGLNAATVNRLLLTIAAGTRTVRTSVLPR